MRIKPITADNACGLLYTRNCTRLARPLGLSPSVLLRLRRQHPSCQRMGQFIFEALEVYFGDMFQLALLAPSVSDKIALKWLMPISPIKLPDDFPIRLTNFYEIRKGEYPLNQLSAVKRQALDDYIRQEARHWLI